MDLLQPLGIVVQGSLSDGLEVRLNGEISVEDMRVGKFLVVHGRHTRFFCILTDVTLGTASPRILMNPPDPENTFLTEILAGTGTFGTINLTPMLMFVPSNPFDLITQRSANQHSDRVKKSKRKKSPAYEAVEEINDFQLLPVKTIPSHFSQVFDATERDFRIVFGWEDDPHKRQLICLCQFASTSIAL
jgi:uncharacterized protein